MVGLKIVPFNFVIIRKFCENPKSELGTELAKSAYYGQYQFTICTACCYYNSNQKSCVKNICLVTNENDYSCDTTFSLNMELIKKMDPDKC